MEKFMKSCKGKAIIALSIVLLVAVGIYGLYCYNEYKKSLISHVQFVSELVIGTSDDPLSLIESHDADEVKCTKIVAGNVEFDASELEELKPGEYKFYYLFTNGGKNSGVAVNVMVEDNTAPVLVNVVPQVEVDYGTTYSPDVSAIDNIDGRLEVSFVQVESVTPQTIYFEYTATDSAGNQSKLVTTLTIKAPTCALNATFDWEKGDCACNKGYSGDGWLNCLVIKGSSTASGNNSSSQATGNKSGTSNSTGDEEWTVDWNLTNSKVPQAVIDEASSKYDANYSYGGIVGSDGTIISEWGVEK